MVTDTLTQVVPQCGDNTTSGSGVTDKHIQMENETIIDPNYTVDTTGVVISSFSVLW